MNLSHIRSTNSKPEETVRKYLFSKGLRYRKNVKDLPGKPDIVLKRYHTVEYWKATSDRNVQRDQEEKILLENDGWKVLVIWECQLKKKVSEKNLKSLYEAIIAGRDA